jgi:hypothetical protein
VWLATLYYRHLLLVGKDLSFGSIVVFWGAWVLDFGGLYQSLYLLRPNLFVYVHPPLVSGKTIQFHQPFSSFLMTIQFNIYSACTTVSMAIPNLASSSFLISAINAAEVIGFVLLVALIIATFASKAADRKDV